MKVMKAYWEGMEVYWAGKKFEEGEHEAILQVMEIKPSPFDEDSTAISPRLGNEVPKVTAIRFLRVLPGSRLGPV